MKHSVMTNSCVYIYRNYDDDGLVPEYLDVREYYGTILCCWCTYVHDATAFNSLKEAKHYIAKYIEKFGNTKYHFAFMESAIVMKDYYSHEILEEV